MKKYFSISETAKAVGMTSETLRHYDRIGLVKPCKRDEWTNYRYYTQQDIVLLHIIHALQQMDLSLKEIKEALALNDLEKIIEFFQQAEKNADRKIAELQYSKAKIRSARIDYEKKLGMRQNENKIFEKEFPERVIMLSETLEEPTLETLWNYLSHFYNKISPDKREMYEFDDLAGVYTENGIARMFALCRCYESADSLKILPAGMYLCVDCTENERKAVLEAAVKIASERSGAAPPFTVQQVVVSSILNWNYQIQIPIDY